MERHARNIRRLQLGSPVYTVRDGLRLGLRNIRLLPRQRLRIREELTILGQ